MKNKLIIFIVLLCVSVSSFYSQNKTIKGRVISEDFETLARVSIRINDTIEVGSTDAKGFFQINIPISEKKISFKTVGFESTTIELVDKCDKIEVVMMYIHTYDFVSLRRAERKRKKRYKKITEIHEQAFNKSIFETKCICYNRKFEPFYIQEKGHRPK